MKAKNPNKKTTYRIIKFILDEIIALVSIIILLPLFLVISIIIKIDSRGPVIYRQERFGKNKRIFKIYKFRTMIINAEKNGGKITGKNDMRVTRVGRVLRGLKIDELPQLLNILFGQMSIIGPRPEVEKFISLYAEKDQLVFTVRPGLSDYSSIKYMNMDEIFTGSDPDSEYINKVFADKNKLRLKYVQDFSFWVDVKIFFGTIFGLIKKIRLKLKKKSQDKSLLVSNKSSKETRQSII